MPNQKGYLYDNLGNKIAPRTTADQVVTKLDGTRTLDMDLVDINAALAITTNDKGFFSTPAALQTAHPVGQNGWHAITGITDTVWIWDTNTTSWKDSDSKGAVVSVNGHTGVVVLAKTDVGLSNVDNTSDMSKPVSTATQTALSGKLDTNVVVQSEGSSTTNIMSQNTVTTSLATKATLQVTGTSTYTF